LAFLLCTAPEWAYFKLFQVHRLKSLGETLVASELFTKWLNAVTPSHDGIALYSERPAARSVGLNTLGKLLIEHFVGEATIVGAGGYKKAAAIISNSLPSNKKTRSGDLGELLATEYVNSETDYTVPIKKLRWKSDRQMPMHGNDVVGIDSKSKPVRVLKGECKSRAAFSKSVADEALKSLDLHDGRPNPSTLAFIAKRLYEEKRDAEADVFRDLQCKGTIAAKNITHMTFVLSGNDPAKYLAEMAKSKHVGIKRENAGIVISDHAAFVAAVFKKYGA
jgi:hypothetical protein